MNKIKNIINFEITMFSINEAVKYVYKIDK